jgi:hypothetical protein
VFPLQIAINATEQTLWREVVSPRVQRYLDRAEECEDMAAKAKGREALFLTKDASHWRDLARQAEDWERVRDSMTENLRQLQITRLVPIELGD